MTKLVRLGVIVATHGVKGRVKIKSFAKNPRDLTAYGDISDNKGRVFKIKVTGEQPENLLCEIEGVNSMDAAEELLGTELFVAREKMPEPPAGTYYYEDLKGLSLKLQSGEDYGQIYSVVNYGAGTIVEIRRKDGVEEAFTFDSRSFPEVDIKQGYAVFNPPEIIEAKE